MMGQAAKSAGSFLSSTSTMIGMTEAGMSLGSNDALLAAAANIPTGATLGGNVTVHPKPQVPEMNLGRSGGGGKGAADHSEADAAEDQWRKASDAAREYDQQTQTILDGELKRHEITEEEWLKQTTTALEGEKTAIEQAAQTALASAALSSEQKLEIQRREAREIAKIGEEELKAQEKVADDAAKAWDSFFKPFNSAIESQMSALISGHETVGAALKKTLNSMTQTFSNSFSTGR